MGKINIISFGAGQNSTAMIIEMYNKGLKIDDIIFADTGNEMPETYNFLPIFKKWCKKRKLKFTTVKSHLGSVRDFYYSKKLIPFRMFRSCTDKFKIRPIHKYLKEKYPKQDINMFLGIGSDETKRAKKSTKFNMKYPLIDWGINRRKCVEIIKKERLEVPVKSGCYFCPFQTIGSWKQLYMNHSNLFDETIEFEKNCSKYPKATLTNKPLIKIKEDILKQKTLTEYNKVQQCCFCHT